MALQKKTLILSTLGTFFILAGVGSYALKGHSSEAGTPPAENTQAQAMPVTVMRVTPKPVQLWVQFSGRMVAVDFAEIRPQVSGLITQIKFQDGQNVVQGDLLFVIDPRPYEAAVEQATAQLAAAENRADYAKREFDRSKELIKKKAISQSLYDNRENELLLAHAAVKEAQAQLTKANLDLDYAYVKAPISGRISRAEVTVGNLVESGSGAPLLTSIVSKDGIYADFEMDEQTYLSYVQASAKQKGEAMSIPVKLYTGTQDLPVAEGYIRSFDNRIDPATGTVRARAYFDNQDGLLVPGMYARVSVGGANTDNRIVLPERAIGTNQDRKFVYVVPDSKEVEYREVTLGESVNGNRIITSGLNDGDLVITEAVIRIRPGAVVEPKIETEDSVQK